MTEKLGGSPGLEVMGRDSCSEGYGFESQQHIVDGQFFTSICCKNWNEACLKRPKYTINEAKVGPFLKRMAEKLNVEVVQQRGTLSVKNGEQYVGVKFNFLPTQRLLF